MSVHENALQLEGASPFDEEEEAVLRAEEPRKLRRNSRRRSVESKRREKEEVPELERDGEQVVDDQERVEPIPRIESGGDYVYVSFFSRFSRQVADLSSSRPSCTHSLRRQWQTLSLRFRFGVFHMKQRLRRSLRN